MGKIILKTVFYNNFERTFFKSYFWQHQFNRQPICTCKISKLHGNEDFLKSLISWQRNKKRKYFLLFSNKKDIMLSDMAFLVDDKLSLIGQNN